MAEAMDELASLDPTDFLTPSSALSDTVRSATRSVYELLAPCLSNAKRGSTQGAPKAPVLSELYTNGFDAEQIWLQIDSQAGAAISVVNRNLKKVLKKAEDGEEAFLKISENGHEAEITRGADDGEGFKKGNDASEDGERVVDDGDSDSDEMASDEEEEDDDDELTRRPQKRKPVEDKFLSLDDMEKFLLDAEESEQRKRDGVGDDEDEDDDLDDDENEDGIDDLLRHARALAGKGGKGGSKRGKGAGKDMGDEDEDEEEDDDDGNDIRYEDFFGKGEKGDGRGKGKKKKSSAEFDMDKWEEGDDDGQGGQEDDEDEDEDEDERDREEGSEEGDGAEIDLSKLSSHERRLLKTREKIAELERSNLDNDKWTMKGEVTAAKRPQNSALEVDLDFEHAVRPPPVITEEITASLEDMIKQRIIEGRYDDPQRKFAPAGPVREKIEIDETKSAKGLAEVYEEEYMRSTGQAPPATSSVDEIKREAALLFKSLCAKLDALSHFHFAPKPVVEDMTIRAPVPAIAMEEVIPVAVSEAHVLAPEEVYKGGASVVVPGGGEEEEEEGRGMTTKGRGGGVRGSAAGAVRGEGELDREDRQRLRAKRKRQKKGTMKEREEEQRKRLGLAAVEAEKTAREMSGQGLNGEEVEGQSSGGRRKKTHFTKSAQVFSQLQERREDGAETGARRAGVAAHTPHESSKGSKVANLKL